jgi:hypothetical protein
MGTLARPKKKVVADVVRLRKYAQTPPNSHEFGYTSATEVTFVGRVTFARPRFGRAGVPILLSLATDYFSNLLVSFLLHK